MTFHCAGCQFLYGLSITIIGSFLQFLFLNSPVIIVGAFVTVGGLYNVFRGYLHIRKRNRWLPLDKAILEKVETKQQ